MLSKIFRLFILSVIFCSSGFARGDEDAIVDTSVREVFPYVYYFGEKHELKPGTQLINKFLRGQGFEKEYGRLYDVNLDRSNLESAYFGKTAFIRWSFRGTNMRNIKTEWTEFIDCDFTGANITGAQFEQLSTKNLAQTVNYSKYRNLSNIKIETWTHGSSPDNLKRELAQRDEDSNWSAPDPNDTGFDFSECNLENSWLPDNLKGCDFTDAQINGARLASAVLKDGSRSFTMKQLKSTHTYKTGALVNVTFEGMDFSDMDFTSMNLTGCRLLLTPIGISVLALKCNMQNAVFTDAVISNCDFRGTENLTLEQIKSTWNYKNNRMVGITLPEEIQAALDAEKEQP